MDHPSIEETGIVDRYILGQLPPEEREAFEDHFLDCPVCLESLELTRRMHDGIARVASEEVARTSAVRQLGVAAALARLAGSRRAGLLFTVLLVAVLMPAGLLWRRAAHLDRELEETRIALREARETAPPPGAPPPGLARELADSRRALAEERERSAKERESERREQQRLAAELTAARQPQTNTPIIPLSPERSGPGDGEPATRITLAPSPEWIVFFLEPGGLEPGGLDEGAYRATLLRGGGRIWQGTGLEPDPAGSLVVSFHSSLLAPGDYTLELETAPRSGKPAPVASFRFRVRQGR
jgi:hypothetical protein